MPELYDKITGQTYDLVRLVKTHGNKLTIGRKKHWIQFLKKQPIIQLGTNNKGNDTLELEYKEHYGLSINHAKIVYEKELGIFSVIKNKSSSIIFINRVNENGICKLINLPHIQDGKIISKATLIDKDEINFGVYGPVIYKK